MKKSTEVVCLGEAIIDLVSLGTGGLEGARGFLKCAGGASANVAVGLSRLGVRSAFAGKVGNDPFGRFLVKEMAGRGVETSGVVIDAAHRTRLAFVALARGEREFEFWEARPAGGQLRRNDVNVAELARAKIVHIDSLLLLGEPSRSTALAVATTLHRRGCVLSFDPNLRLSLWEPRSRAILLKMIRCASIVRMNLEEALFLSGRKTLPQAVGMLHTLGPRIVVVTKGRNGSYGSVEGKGRSVAGFAVTTVDTTGCGDAFLAALLAGILRCSSPVSGIGTGELHEFCRFANAAGALAATRRGAIPALPSRARVARFLAARGNR